MNVINKTQYATFEASSTLSYAGVGHGIAVFRLDSSLSSEEVVPGLLKHHVFDRQTEGFAKLSAIKAYLAGKATELGDNSIVLTVEELLPNIALEGFIRGYEATSSATNANFSDGYIAHPYTAVVEERASLERIVRIDHSSHMVFALDGRSLPVGITHGYMDGRMTNGRYDLQKALAILKKNPRVRFLDPRGTGPGEKAIQTVPYYNRDPACSTFLHFIYEPTPEEAIALWDKQQSYKTKYPSTVIHRAMFDLDILGLRAGGAAYYEDFDKDRRYDKEHINDDPD